MKGNQTTTWHARLYNAVKGIIRDEDKHNPVSDRAIADIAHKRDKTLEGVTAYHVSTKRKELGLAMSYKRRKRDATK